MGNIEMSKTKALPMAPESRAALKPAHVADAQLDHLEHMIVSFAQAGDAAPLGCLDCAYWRRRLSALSTESDLVSVQRARVLKLLDILDQAQDRAVHPAGPNQVAA
jgi:hypothetical protein